MFQEWLSYEYNEGLLAVFWHKKAVELCLIVYSSVGKNSPKPYCIHCIRFVKISTIMGLMLYMLNQKWQLLLSDLHFSYRGLQIVTLYLWWPFQRTQLKPAFYSSSLITYSYTGIFFQIEAPLSYLVLSLYLDRDIYLQANA